MMFVRSESGKALINVSHIVSVGIKSPYLEQRNYTVVAYLASNGSYCLYKGSEEACENYLMHLESAVNN